MTTYKHSTLLDRNDIQSGSDKTETFQTIGQKHQKKPTTIAKEV